MVILRVLSCRIQATFLFPRSARFRFMWRHSPWRLPYGERRPLLVRFRVRRSYSNRCPPCVLKIPRRSDLGGPAIFQNLPHIFSLLKCSISGKTGLSESSSYDEGPFPENSSSLISRRPFRISLKTIYE